MRWLLLIQVLPVLPVILAALALAGWAFDIELLKRGMFSSVAMNPTTAVCMILLAFEAIRSNTGKGGAVLYKAGQMAVMIVIAVSTMKLGDIVFGSSFAMDQLFFSAKLNAEPDHPSRMAPNTAACFLVLGLAMQFMRGRSDSSALKAQLLAVAAMLLALLALIGHMFDTRALSGIAHYIPMAINTALAFLLIAASVLFAYPDKGFMRVFVSQDSPSSKAITNILLPASILIPIGFGLLNHIGADRGFFDMEFALALTVPMNIMALLALSYISARKLFLSDIERKRIGAALYDSELRLRTIVEAEPECIKTLSADGMLLSMNRAGLDMIEADSADQVIGRSLAGVIEPAYLDDFNALNAAAFRGESGNLEFKIRGIKGAPRWLEAHTVPLRDKLGDIAASLSVARDITERKLADEKLRKSEASLRAILDNMPYLAWLKDTSGSFIAVNDAFIKTTVQKRMLDVLGKTDLDLWPKELAEKYRADDAEVMASRQQKYVEESVLADDRSFWVETFKTPVIDENGNMLGTTGFARDITERKEHEEELKRSNADLEQFSYAVSHDMRQPLRMISSYLQLLELKLAGQLDGEKRDYLDFAIEGAKRIDQMLVELLEYSRIGKMGEPHAWIDSRAVIDEALQFLQPAIAEAGAKLAITGEWPHVLVCHDEILRLLQNLIGNAAKFRVAGRIPEITVTSEVRRNEWHLSVTDNGIGIIPEQNKRLFQVFQRLQSRETYEGTGIGLALCRKIAEHHKGHVWAESAGEDKGSSFHVVLPVTQKKALSEKGATP